MEKIADKLVVIGRDPELTRTIMLMIGQRREREQLRRQKNERIRRILTCPMLIAGWIARRLQP